MIDRGKKAYLDVAFCFYGLMHLPKLRHEIVNLDESGRQ